MTSIDRWLHDGPELHERLVPGAAPRREAVNAGSAGNLLQAKNSKGGTQNPVKSLTAEENGILPAAGTFPVPTTESEDSTWQSNSAGVQRTGSSTNSAPNQWIGERRYPGIFSRFATWISNTRRSRRSGPKAASESSLPSHEQSRSSTPFSTPERLGKRLRGRRGTNKSDSEEDKREKRAKQQKRAEKRAEQAGKPRYACPLYQHNPDENQFHSCSGEGFETIHRVKDHLKRRHRPKDNAELRQASRRVRATEQVTDDQWATLEDLRKLVHGKEWTEKWNIVYKILFPDEVTIPYAYVEPKKSTQSTYETRDVSQCMPGTPQSELAGFENFVARRASHHIEKHLQNPDEPAAYGMSHDEKTKLVTRFPHLVASLIQDYREGTKTTHHPTEEHTTPTRRRGMAPSAAAFPTAHLDEPVGGGFEMPQLPPMAPIKPLGIIDRMTAARSKSLYRQATEEDRVGGSFLNSLRRDAVAFDDQSHQTRVFTNASPSTVNPGSLSISGSDVTSGYNQIFSSDQQSPLDQNGGSFTTAPSREAGKVADQLEFDESWLERLLENPDCLADEDFNFDYSLWQDINAIGTDDNRAAQLPVDSSTNISSQDIAQVTGEGLHRPGTPQTDY